jgi:hypothetical protein
MSITIGKIISEILNDNRLKVGTYNNSNVININTDIDNYKDCGINFKNNYFLGYSNLNFTLNSINSNLININDNKSHILNDLYVKTLINTSNDHTFIYSNLTFKLTSNINNSFQVLDSNNNRILFINSSNLNININNSNKLTINSNGIQINDNITISSNKDLLVSSIKNSVPNTPVLIDNVIFNKLNIDNYNVKTGIIIDNETIVPQPSIKINRYQVDCNIVEISNKYYNSSNSNIIFSINKDGYIGIGSNISKSPLDINLNIPIHSNVISYTNINSNISAYYFNVNSRGYVGIGTDFARNHIHINIKDDSNNVINPPVIHLNLNYNSNNNYRTSNIVDLRFIAAREYKYNYNNEDALISSNLETIDNFICSFTSNINEIPGSLPPTPANRRVIFSITNTINNDYIEKNKISSIVPYNSCNYLPFLFTFNQTDYNINYTLRYVRNIFNVDINEIIIDGQRTTPIYTQTNNNHNITYTTYIIKSTTIKPYYDSNLILKEIKTPIYNINPLIRDDYIIYLNQRLYIEKGIYELKSFTDTLTYLYQPPSHLLYATSNNNFSISISSDGKMALGDISPSATRDYYLYVNKKSRLDNIEIFNISSIEGKNNVNFSYCNISNINKIFATSNITKILTAETAYISNINISNISALNLSVNEIKIKDLSFERITGSNLSITSNLLNGTNMKILMGTNEGQMKMEENKYYMSININSNINRGINIASYYSNLNPSLALSGYSNNNYPFLIFNNQSSSYSLQVNSNNKSYLLYDNFSLIDNNNNRTVFKHVNYNNNDNQFIFGSSNNIIFDLKPEAIPTNTTNKISLGYPYRYLLQNNLNVNNWENHFKTNIITNDCMLNVYGNVNLSSINNTSFIKCIASEFPNEIIGVGIGTNPRSSFLLTVGGLSYFSSNINVEKDVFVKGTIGNVSDIRVKQDLKIIKDALIKIEQLNGYIYRRIDTKRIETGLVAQEVLKVLPEVIFEADGKYNVSYGNMCGLLVEGIKDLNTRVKNLELIIKTLLFTFGISILIYKNYYK